MKLATTQGCGRAQLGPAALTVGQRPAWVKIPRTHWSLLICAACFVLLSPMDSVEMPKEGSLRDELQF